MVIFIDESGIHKQTGHATSAVIYIEVENLVRFESKLKKIEADLKISYFHWAEEKDAKKWFNKLKRDKKLSFELLVNQP